VVAKAPSSSSREDGSVTMREVWTLNVEGAPDGARPLPSDTVVSACAWSEDGLIAYTSSASRPAAQAALCGHTSVPAIFIVHVDHPERHSQLSGGHEHDIAHLAWVHRQMGTVLMSADERSCICLWKPVQVATPPRNACFVLCLQRCRCPCLLEFRVEVLCAESIVDPGPQNFVLFAPDSRTLLVGN